LGILKFYTIKYKFSALFQYIIVSMHYTAPPHVVRCLKLVCGLFVDGWRLPLSGVRRCRTHGTQSRKHVIVSFETRRSKNLRHIARLRLKDVIIPDDHVQIRKFDFTIVA